LFRRRRPLSRNNLDFIDYDCHVKLLVIE